ncbi:MAG: hypothetical protein CMO26_12045 [Thiotrichales bacterium]|nr:hypothetical protein [Thiotrichales bacterium]
MLYPMSWYLYFLAGLLGVYWGVCRNATHKKLLLIVSSVALLASLQPWFTAGLLIWTAVVYLAANYLLSSESSKRLRLLVVVMLALLGYLSFFKYLPGLLEVLLSETTSTGAMNWLESNVVLPIGVSYFTFKFLHYLTNAYRRTLVAHAPIDFVLYTVFFPIVPAGPIERIENFVANKDLKWSSEHVSTGTLRLIFGAAKKLVLVDLLLATVVTGPVYDDLMGQRFDHVSVPLVWMFLVCSFLYAYLDFSAYTDLAVGTARLFGFKICENFNYPIFKPNLSAFWKSWHMSLSSWCRDYIYIPVLAKTRMPKLALYASMMTIGAWHFVNFNWLVWGALHATGLIALLYWQQFRKRRLKFLKQCEWGVYGVGNVITMAYVSWVFAFVCLPSPVVSTQTFLFAITGWTW